MIESDKKVLVLQGGGALGAYQAGAYEALHSAGMRPEWVAGISIGAINSAIIVGSPAEQRVARLRDFWETVSTGPGALPFSAETSLRQWFNEASSAYNATFGVPGFYAPRLHNPWSMFKDENSAISFYDTSALRDTLERLVDFNLVNHGPIRLSVGAVHVVNGNFAYFDNKKNSDDGVTHIDARHIMASGALPPGFPPVEIDNDAYWDGGLVSNTPLQWVTEQRRTEDDICIFQVDLFSAHGEFPKSVLDVIAREKEIRFSSRTRLNTDMVGRTMKLRKSLQRLLAKLPPEFANDADVQILKAAEDEGGATVVQLIYQRRAYETNNADNEFSRLTMEDHWRAGFDDVRATLDSSAWKNRRIPDHGFATIDWRRDLAKKSAATAK